MDRVRLRFAPSPTGPLHIGGARSALFNYLFAKKYGGDFILRIEDTDLERSSRESEENIKDALKWIGVNWNEGIDVGGDYGPYRQTERLDLYNQYVNELMEKGFAYRCYCSPEELEDMREEQKSRSEMPRYDGRCRNLSKEQEEAYIAEGRKPVIRFRVPQAENIVIDDLVRGKVTFESDGIGDFVIVKSDGIPTYNFAVVVDDYTMKISHVVRGEEHLSNTPRQVLIYQALGLEQPKFAHVSLILGKDRSKMSKRHGSTSVVNYVNAGFLPEGLVNFLVLLGWSPEGEDELFSMQELEQLFDLDRVAKNPAVFDMDKLNWINHQHIQRADEDRLTELAIPYLVESGYLEEAETKANYQKIKSIVAVVKTGLDHMSQISEKAELFFGSKPLEDETAKEIISQDFIPNMLKQFVQLLSDKDELTPAVVKKCFKETMKTMDLKGKQVFMPVRIALTGVMSGPEMHELIPVLGVDEVKERIFANTAIRL
ncbi:glutamate--tRNA ligase [Clostridia bacterium]|nr:glutamate--tRNA ligase [Clostridia bacterium]